LKQCDDGATFSTKSWKNYRERVELSFHWDTCDIEGMVEEKMVSSSFGGVSDTWRWQALGAPALSEAAGPML
jgi:hypothetical protein